MCGSCRQLEGAKAGRCRGSRCHGGGDQLHRVRVIWRRRKKRDVNPWPTSLSLSLSLSLYFTLPFFSYSGHDIYTHLPYLTKKPVVCACVCICDCEWLIICLVVSVCL